MKAQYLKKILLALSFLCLFSYTNHVLGQPDLKVKVNILGKNNSKELRNYEGKFYSMSIDMINNTDSAIRFWRIVVWEIGFISNDEKIIPFIPRNVDRDFDFIQQIESGQKLILNGDIQIVGPLKSIKNKYYKFGFIFINEAEVKEDRDFLKVLRNKKVEGKDIIWSEPFKIL